MPVDVWGGSAWKSMNTSYVDTGTDTPLADTWHIWDGTSWILVWPVVTGISVTGTSWVMSSSCPNPSGYNVINSTGTFTAKIDNPAVVAKVDWYLKNPSGLWEVSPRQTNNNPTGDVSFSLSFSTYGQWYVRALVTLIDDSTVASNDWGLRCYLKGLTATVTNNGSIGGAAATFSAACTNECLPAQQTGGWYWRNGSTWTLQTTSNPGSWSSPTGNRDLYWRETFSNGSILYSNVAQVRPTQAHYHEVVPSGSSRATIQAAINRAYNYFIANQGAKTNYSDEYSMACVELVAGGTYTLDGTALYYRRGVRLIGGGSGGTRPLVKGTSASHIFKGNNNGGGNYNAPHYDWLVKNIRFDCGNYMGGFSIAHVRRFRIEDCYFSNLGGRKHYIEVNSSGGTRSDGTYNCEIINCYFTAPNTKPTNSARRTEDECIQLDYSWTGAASDVANDGTMANNVKISGCTFYRVARAVGGHHYEFGTAGEANPDGIHSNIWITGCTFNQVNPDLYGDGANSQNSEGAVRAYFWRYVRVTNNTFLSCLQPVNFFIADQAATTRGEPGQYYVQNNTFTSATATTRPLVNSHSSRSGAYHEQCLAEYNTFDGTWNTNDFAIDFDDTGTETLPSSPYGVVIRYNTFNPSNLSLSEEKAYNKYSRNTDPMVYVYSNYVSDGSVDNS